MPRTNFSDDHAGGTGGNQFPKLKLEKHQRSRIGIVEAPWTEWTHELRAPKIESGVATMETRKRQDGTTWQDYEKVFIGRPICLGDPSVLADRGVDGDSCPACAASLRSDQVPGPVRRFAMNVLQYAVYQDQALSVATPFSAKILLWAFTQKVYDKLLGIRAEWGNLKDHDLIIGPPEEPVVFQRFPIAVGQQATHKAAFVPEGYFKALWTAENKASDDQLQAACGRVTTFEYLTSDVDRVEQLYAQAKQAGTGGGEFSQVQQASLQEGVDALLGAHPDMHPAEAAAAEAADPFAPSAQTQAALGVTQEPSTAGEAAAVAAQTVPGGMAEFTAEGTSNPEAVASDPHAPIPQDDGKPASSAASSFDDFLEGL